MHLLPVYYTTTSTRKRKKGKKSKSLLKAEAEHQKFLKKMGVGKKRASVAQKEEQLICNHQVVGSIPTTGTTRFEPCIKPEPKVYTGTEIIGIGQMHKSNAVPIRRKEDAKSLANMRR